MKDYVGKAVTVRWDAKRCIHFAYCTRSLPAVFDAARRPWIDPDAADADAVIAAVEACPTGALHYVVPDGHDGELPSAPTVMIPLPGGPLLIRGDLLIQRSDGVSETETRAALCRCGRSGNQPFCDNSHRSAEASGTPAVAQSPADICTRQEL